MRTLLVIAAIAIVALPATAQITCCYSWEDGGTIMGYYGNVADPTNVSGVQIGDDSLGGTYSCPGAYDGTYYLHIAEEPLYSTPQAYVAWIKGLVPGDVITVSFYGYDVTPGASPSLRAWGHYAMSDDINNYVSSPGLGSDYTAGNGWDYVEYTITFDGGSTGLADAWVVEARLYSGSGGTRGDYWVDYICVTAPTTASIEFPQGATPVEPSTWSAIKALYNE